MSLVRVSGLGAWDDPWGDILPTAAHCSEGEVAVAGLRAFWDDVVDRGLLPAVRYESAVASLEAELESALDEAGWWRLFDGDCISAAKVGRRALALQEQIAAAARVETTPGPPADRTGAFLGGVADKVLFGAVVLGGLWIFLNSKQ